MFKQALQHSTQECASTESNARLRAFLRFIWVGGIEKGGTSRCRAEPPINQSLLNLRVGALLGICLIWVSMLSYSAWAQTYEDTIELVSGQTDILAYRNVTRVSIGNGALADVSVLEDAGQVLIIAKSPGITDLRIWTSAGEQFVYLLRIVNLPAEEILGQVKEHLADVEGVQARLVGERVIIEGQSLRESDLEKINLVSQVLPNVTSYVTSGGITVRSMIMMDVKVLEVRKNDLKNIGVNYADVTEGPTFGLLSDFATNDVFRSTLAPIPDQAGFFLPPPDVGSRNAFFGISTRLTSLVNLLVQKGHAKLLAEPKLVSRSGGQAEFLAGGEVPIPISNALGALNVTFKQFGIILRMAPLSDAEGFISTNIEVEVSTIDPAVAVLGIPGFATRRTNTDMNVRQGQTMVISGLLSSEDSKTVDKLPGLGSIPIIGELFKSRDFRSNQTDLVIFVTPYIVDPDHERNQQLLQHAEKIESAVDETLKFHLMD